MLARASQTPVGVSNGDGRTRRIKRSTKLAVAAVLGGKLTDEHARGQWALNDELLGLAVQVGGIGIFDTDLVGERTRFSPELCIILGLPAGTVMTHAQALLLFDERDRAAVNAIVEAGRNAADKGKWSGEFRVLRADGKVRWVYIHGRRHYRGRQPVRSIGTVIDISHLKETEAALRQSELRLRVALEAAQMGTFEADVAASESIIDAQEAHLLGLPKDTRIVSAEALRAHVPLEDLEASDAKLERLRQYGEPYHHEFRVCMPDGSERWLSGRAGIRSNRIFGVNFDVTERKRAEAALRESEARLRIAVSGAALGIFEQDVKADRTVWINDRMYEIFGRTRADGSLSKQEFVENYLHRDDAHAFEAARSHALRSGGNFQAICRIHQKSGSLRWLQIDGKFDLTDTGEPLRLVGVVADVTERKALEQETADLSDRLMSLQEEERQRIAQELHDSTVQHLVAATLNLMNLRSRAGPSSGEVRLWDEVEGSMQEAMKELRTFSYLTHPPALHSDGLHSSVRQLTSGYAERSGVVVTFKANADVDQLPFQTQRALLRIVQEALANIHRHASASHVSIGLRRTAGWLHLIIADNGRVVEGMSEAGRAPLRPGIGIPGIRARVQQLSGDFKIQTGTRGTRIHVAVPMGQPPHQPSRNCAQAFTPPGDGSAR